MIDRYTKVVLTVIAVGLVGVNLKLWEPREAHAATSAQTATMKESVSLEALMKSKNLGEAEQQKLISKIPVVAVWAILNK